VNHCESEALAQKLASQGWQAATDGQPADISIINTCTVTQKASMQSRQLVRQSIRSHPEGRVVVTGCYAQTEPNALKQIDGAEVVAPPAGNERLDSLVKHLNPEAPKGATDPNIASTRAERGPTPETAQRSRPFLKIQDGCNSFCAYCIVPHARGRSRSLPVGQVQQKLRALQAAGFYEIVLTGIHLGIYGRDLTPATDLQALLKQTAAQAHSGRLRLSSIEPKEISDAIIELVASCDLFCKHLHIPLQSGDDRILERMHRPYNRLFFKKRVEKIHTELPEAAIGADILVGFPGESDAAFENTYRLVEQLPLSYLHVFPFSARPGTPAAGYQDHIAPQTIKERCRRMRCLGRQKKEAFLRKFIGRTYPVLIENKRDKASGLLRGLTTNYIAVLLEGPDTYKNKVVDTKIRAINENLQALGDVC
jgi:threonylcarbamoyladenosine tRNA methylthiotransferase MtaB